MEFYQGLGGDVIGHIWRIFRGIRTPGITCILFLAQFFLLGRIALFHYVRLDTAPLVKVVALPHVEIRLLP